MNEHSWRELVGEERPVGFDQVAIGVASSDTMRSWSKGRSKIRKQSITGPLNREGWPFLRTNFGPTGLGVLLRKVQAH